jgi:hypothetical protein
MTAGKPMNAQLLAARYDVWRVNDIEAANKFWQALGGEPGSLAAI